MALEHEIAEISEEASVASGNDAVGEGERKLFQEALDFFRRHESAGRSGEFAVQIGGAKAAMRGVSMGVAEAVAVGMGRLSAATAVEEGVAAEWEIGGVLALAGHCESIANVPGMEK